MTASWPADPQLIPGPQLVGAWVALEVPVWRRAPYWAAVWLTAGFESASTIRLASLSSAVVISADIREALDSLNSVPATITDAVGIAFAGVCLLRSRGYVGDLESVRNLQALMASGGGWGENVPSLRPLEQLVDVDEMLTQGGLAEQQLAGQIVSRVCDTWLSRHGVGLTITDGP